MFSKSVGMSELSNPCVSGDSSSFIISESLGASWAVESLCLPWQQFVDDIWVPRALWAVESMHHSWHSSLMIYECAVAVLAVNYRRHLWQYFDDDLCVLKGCVCYRIHASPMTAVSLIISESLRAVLAVESMRHPWQQFVDYFWVARGVLAVESMRLPWQLFR